MFSEVASITRVLVIEPKGIVEFKADHPFIFAIKNREDTLFTGTYIEA